MAVEEVLTPSVHELDELRAVILPEQPTMTVQTPLELLRGHGPQRIRPPGVVEVGGQIERMPRAPLPHGNQTPRDEVRHVGVAHASPRCGRGSLLPPRSAAVASAQAHRFKPNSLPKCEASQQPERSAGCGRAPRPKGETRERCVAKKEREARERCVARERKLRAWWGLARRRTRPWGRRPSRTRCRRAARRARRRGGRRGRSRSGSRRGRRRRSRRR